MHKNRIQSPYSHGPFSLQTFPEALFYHLISEQRGKELFFIPNGIPHAEMPVIICPSKHSSHEICFGLYRNTDGAMVFYLFNNGKPYDHSSSISILWEVRGGEWKAGKYHNTYKMGRHTGKKIDLAKNQPQIINWVQTEAIKLLYHPGKYLLEEKIDPEYVLKIPPFKSSDYQVIKKTRH
jgi:hypothetical protein